VSPVMVRVSAPKYPQVELILRVLSVADFAPNSIVEVSLVGKPQGKRPLGRPRHRWGDGIRMDLRETGLGGVDWIRLS
jgi:hypothetical protein